jgi:hypothetical protein
MVEASRAQRNDDRSMNSDAGTQNEDSYMQGDDQVDMVIKPRNNYSSNALRRAVPRTDLNKKRESLSMSLINMGAGGRSASRLFNSASLASINEDGRR